MSLSASVEPASAPSAHAVELRWSPIPFRTVSRAAFAAVVLLICATPFERSAAWVGALGQQLTNVESLGALVLLTSAMAWAMTGARTSGRALAAPWGALLVVLGLSAWLAPINPGPALKSVGRLAAAGCIAAAVASCATSSERRVWLARTSLAVGVLVAVLGVLESQGVAWALDLLTAFRPGIHVVGGQIRATSTLQYPTITSMHLEIVFAIGLGVLLHAIDAGRSRLALVIVAALMLVAEGIAVTFTRAGLLTTLLGIGLVGYVRWRRRGLEPGVLALALLAATSVALWGLTYSTEHLWLRLTTESQADWYRATFDAPRSFRLSPASIVQVPVVVTNAGRVTWHPASDPPFLLSYHWLEANTDRVVHFEGLRTPFPSGVGPGSSVPVLANVEAPARPGRYRLAWDVVHEQRLWFSTEAPSSHVSVVDVEGAPAVRTERPRQAMPVASVRPGRLMLWRAAATMLASRPILGIGLDNFRWMYAAHTGTAHYDTRVHTNNTYLELLVGGGLVGGGVLLWFLSRLGRLLLAVARNPGPDGALGLGLVAAIVAVLVHGMADAFFTFTPSYMMVAVSIGLLLAVATPPAEAHAHRV